MGQNKLPGSVKLGWPFFTDKSDCLIETATGFLIDKKKRDMQDWIETK